MRGFSRLCAVAGLLTASVVAASGLGATAGADAGAWTGGPVTIRVELDLPESSNSNGPLVEQVTNVTPGDQVELTSHDVVDNPSGWCGTLQVDIDPTTHTVTVATGQKWDGEGTPGPIVAPIDQLSPGYSWDGCDFETAKVAITGGGFEGFEMVSDNLWESGTSDGEDFAPGAARVALVPDPAPLPNQMNLTTSLTGGNASASWQADPTNADYSMRESGQAVFAYTIAEEPTTTTVAPPTTQAPPTTHPAVAPAAATPVRATPAYTG